MLKIIKQIKPSKDIDKQTEACSDSALRINSENEQIDMPVWQDLSCKLIQRLAAADEAVSNLQMPQTKKLALNNEIENY